MLPSQTLHPAPDTSYHQFLCESTFELSCCSVSTRPLLCLEEAFILPETFFVFLEGMGSRGSPVPGVVAVARSSDKHLK